MKISIEFFNVCTKAGVRIFAIKLFIANVKGDIINLSYD